MRGDKTLEDSWKSLKETEVERQHKLLNLGKSYQRDIVSVLPWSGSPWWIPSQHTCGFPQPAGVHRKAHPGWSCLSGCSPQTGLHFPHEHEVWYSSTVSPTGPHPRMKPRSVSRPPSMSGPVSWPVRWTQSQIGAGHQDPPNQSGCPVRRGPGVCWPQTQSPHCFGSDVVFVLVWGGSLGAGGRSGWSGKQGHLSFGPGTVWPPESCVWCGWFQTSQMTSHPPAHLLQIREEEMETDC